MSYIKKIMDPDERLISVLKPHWIYFLEGVFWLLSLTAAGLVLDYYFYYYIAYRAVDFQIDLGFMRFDEKHTPIPWIFMLTGLAVFWSLFVSYLTTEVGLTNQRVIHKKGLFAIDVEEVNLGDIGSEHIVHGWLGWLLNYGKIRLDCKLVDDVFLPALKNPYRLIKAIHRARFQHPAINYDRQDYQTRIAQIKRAQEQAQAARKMAHLKHMIMLRFRTAAF